MQYENRFNAVVEATSDGKLVGYAAVFNSLSHDLGGFREIIQPGAFDRTLTEFPDVLALVEHDVSKPLGRTLPGTLKLTTDEHGLRVEITPPDTSAGRDIVESVRRGDVAGMSFQFRPFPGGDSLDLSGPLPLRILKSVKLKEVSVVINPAYPDTEVHVRALEEARETQRHTLMRMRLQLAEVN
jgi:HK97 family phage prohead protease